MTDKETAVKQVRAALEFDTRINLHRYPYEIKLLQRIWRYRQPEIQGF